MSLSDLARKNGEHLPQRALLARAKVNLSLSIAGKRRDGYHELAGLVAFADYGDELSFAPLPGQLQSDQTRGVQFELTGPFATGLATASCCTQDNLVMKALHSYEQRTGLALSGHLILTKNLPIASGIGGGSSDAAAVLTLLQSLNARPVEPQILHEIALQLGADVPMCLRPAAQWVSGIGEICHPLADFPALACVLVNPRVNVPTGAIFKGLKAPTLATDHKSTMPDDLAAFTTMGALLEWLTETGNDLQAPAICTAPIIADVLKAISRDKNCVLARMSGSGATCFGLYEKSEVAQEAAVRIGEDHPDWWVVASQLK